jgi:hypothetical protein
LTAVIVTATLVPSAYPTEGLMPGIVDRLPETGTAATSSRNAPPEKTGMRNASSSALRRFQEKTPAGYTLILSLPEK